MVGGWAFITDAAIAKRIVVSAVLFALIGISLVEAIRWTAGRHHRATEEEEGQLACEVANVQFEPFYRFFQEPPLYCQRLDTAVRVNLTNQTGKPLYLRSYDVAALAGTEWVPFKNADSAVFEPYALALWD